MAAQEEIVRVAERQAHEIVEDAREREREIRLGAEDYADEVLGNLEVNLDKFLAAVRRGRERLQTPAIGPRAAGLDPDVSLTSFFIIFFFFFFYSLSLYYGRHAVK